MATERPTTTNPSGSPAPLDPVPPGDPLAHALSKTSDKDVVEVEGSGELEGSEGSEASSIASFHTAQSTKVSSTSSFHTPQSSQSQPTTSPKEHMNRPRSQALCELPGRHRTARLVQKGHAYQGEGIPVPVDMPGGGLLASRTLSPQRRLVTADDMVDRLREIFDVATTCNTTEPSKLFNLLPAVARVQTAIVREILGHDLDIQQCARRDLNPLIKDVPSEGSSAIDEVLQANAAWRVNHARIDEKIILFELFQQIVSAVTSRSSHTHPQRLRQSLDHFHAHLQRMNPELNIGPFDGEQPVVAHARAPPPPPSQTLPSSRPPLDQTPSPPVSGSEAAFAPASPTTPTTPALTVGTDRPRHTRAFLERLGRFEIEYENDEALHNQFFSCLERDFPLHFPPSSLTLES